MKKYITMIFSLITLSSIANEYNTQQDIDAVVNAWATKWNITSDVEARFERLTGANPKDIVTFDVKFNQYVSNFFAGRKTTRNATKVYTAPITKQYVVELTHTIDESFKTILSHNGISTIVNDKFINDKSIILNINVDGEYSLNINDGHVIFFDITNGVLTETVTPIVIEEAPKPIVEWYTKEEMDKSYMQYALNYRKNHSDEEVVYHSTVNERARFTLTDVDVTKTDPSGNEVLDTWSSPHSARWTINKSKTRMFYQEKNTSGDYVHTWSAKILSYMYDDTTINLLVKKNKETFTVLISKDGSKVVVAYDSKILIIK